MALSWTANGEPDLAGYNVYRSTSSPVPTGGTPLNGGILLTSPAYTDANVAPGPTYYYVVTAMDLDGLESPPSNEASASIVDDPPAPPQSLAAAPGDHTVSLTWDGERRARPGRLQRLPRTSSPVALGTPLNSSPLDEHHLLRHGLTNGTTYLYVIIAVDAAATRPAPSTRPAPRPMRPAGSALDFDGVNDYVTFGPAAGARRDHVHHRDLVPPRRAPASRPPPAAAGGVTAVPLMTKGRSESDGSNVDMNWFLGITPSNDVLAADFEDNATGANHAVVGHHGHHQRAPGTTPRSPTTGTTWRLYLDGSLETTSRSATSRRAPTASSTPRSPARSTRPASRRASSTASSTRHASGTSPARGARSSPRAIQLTGVRVSSPAGA